ncbi:tubulin binding cofactor A-domain-containing protein [Melampsora americana]|nr:tubulin binding cofactor A-domain-containing protein [Melampsora americana]
MKMMMVKEAQPPRLIAEEKSYREELINHTQTLSDFKEIEGDEDHEWKLKKQKEVIEETKKMIPDAQLRLSKSLTELQELVLAHEDEWAGTEELLKAKELIKDGEQAVEQISKT